MLWKLDRILASGLQLKRTKVRKTHLKRTVQQLKYLKLSYFKNERFMMSQVENIFSDCSVRKLDNMC
jgi:hypothetical protein